MCQNAATWINHPKTKNQQNQEISRQEFVINPKKLHQIQQLTTQPLQHQFSI